jgi:hypothetical protein
MHDATELAIAVQLRLNACELGDPDSLWRTFLEGTFYHRAPQHPGFLAVSTSTGPLIAVFTSLAELERRCGAGRWLSTSGAELLARAPVGHRYVIDPGSRHELVIDPARLRGVAGGPAA